MNYALYVLHNRALDGQVVLVWKSASEYAFSFHDEPTCLRAGSDFVCIGELTWAVEGDESVHELKPVRHRSEKEMQARAERTKRHQEYRQRCWKKYPLEQRLRDL
jgi:hypothetical protein